MIRTWRSFDGVLLFDKPLLLSSNIALQKIRRLFQAEKAGHTGTLDPLATGLLPICFGEATKFSMGLLDADKTYCATMRLGQTTSTGDAEGEILETREVNVTEQQLRDVMQRFIGEIRQVPPMFSALKHQGKPLYEYIRKGETIERQARSAVIHSLSMDRKDGNDVQFIVRCSKGTYVRTLAEDIGLALGSGAHLIALRRMAIANFSIEQAHTLAQLEGMDAEQRDALVLPLDTLLQDFPRIDLDELQATRLAKGQKLGLKATLPMGKYRLYSSERFIGVGECGGHNLAPSRLLASEARRAAQGNST
jgi:tRNA pseudouridine55 synthase